MQSAPVPEGRVPIRCSRSSEDQNGWCRELIVPTTYTNPIPAALSQSKNFPSRLPAECFGEGLGMILLSLGTTNGNIIDYLW